VINIAQDEEYDAEEIDARKRDQALFVAFAPADDPKIAVAVLIENAGHGGAQSAPVARQVLDAYFASESERDPAPHTTAIESPDAPESPEAEEAALAAGTPTVEGA